MKREWMKGGESEWKEEDERIKGEGRKVKRRMTKECKETKGWKEKAEGMKRERQKDERKKDGMKIKRMNRLMKSNEDERITGGG